MSSETKYKKVKSEKHKTVPKKNYRLIKVTYSAKTNPEVMAFQMLVRNYAHDLKQYNIKIRYVKNISVPFVLEVFDRNNMFQYRTQDYRRLKFIIRRVGFFKD